MFSSLTSTSSTFALPVATSKVRLPPISTFSSVTQAARSSFQDPDPFPSQSHQFRSSSFRDTDMNGYGYGGPVQYTGMPAPAPSSQQHQSSMSMFGGYQAPKPTSLRVDTGLSPYGSATLPSTTSSVFGTRNPSPASSTLKGYPSPLDNASSYSAESSADFDADAQKKRNYRKRLPPTTCTACGATETPEWRRGPSGTRTLCNACGLQYQKMFPGGLLPTSPAEISYQLTALTEIRKGRKLPKSTSGTDMGFMSYESNQSKPEKAHESPIFHIGSVMPASKPLGLEAYSTSGSSMAPRTDGTAYSSPFNAGGAFSGTASHHYPTFGEPTASLRSTASRNSPSSLSPASSNSSYSSFGSTVTPQDYAQPATGFGTKSGYNAMSHAKSYGDMSFASAQQQQAPAANPYGYPNSYQAMMNRGF